MNVEILDRMERAVAKVRERLLRATQALNEAGIPYAVAGGNAVASWVAAVDEGAVRNTRDVDLLVRRSDLPATLRALQRAGFVPGSLLVSPCFAMAKKGKPSEAVHLLFAGEKTRPDHVLPGPKSKLLTIPRTFAAETRFTGADEADIGSARIRSHFVRLDRCRSDRRVLAAQMPAGAGRALEAHFGYAGQVTVLSRVSVRSAVGR